MNFDGIKESIESQAQSITIPSMVGELSQSSMPIQIIRRRMTIELRALLVAMIVSIFVPTFIEMAIVPKAIYWCAIVLSILCNLGYMNKMQWFLDKNSSVTGNSRETIIQFINDLELTLLIYKSASFASSILLAIAAITIAMRKPPASLLLEKTIAFELSNYEMLLLLIAIILIVLITRLLVSVSIKLVYGKNLDQLKSVLQSLEE